MSKKLSKSEAEKQIKEFFSNLKDKNLEQVKKMKKFAMKHNIHLVGLRKRFCKKCYSVYRNPKIRIKKGMKSVKCKECGYVSRWGI